MPRRLSYVGFNSVCRNVLGRDKIISKQALGNYFGQIGQYIWDKIIYIVYPEIQEENVSDELLDLLYEKTGKVSSKINFLESSPLKINKNNIEGSLLFYLFSNRSKVIKGYKKRKILFGSWQGALYLLSH